MEPTRNVVVLPQVQVDTGRDLNLIWRSPPNYATGAACDSKSYHDLFFTLSVLSLPQTFSHLDGQRPTWRQPGMGTFDVVGISAFTSGFLSTMPFHCDKRAGRAYFSNMMQIGGGRCHCDENRRLEQLNVENAGSNVKPGQGTRRCSALTSESAGRRCLRKRPNILQMQRAPEAMKIK